MRAFLKSKRFKRLRGLTLLEVLVSISLICTVMVAFASVYPAAFRMNRKTMRANRASEIAGALVEELRAKSCHRPGNFGSRKGQFIEDFVNENDPIRGRLFTTSELKNMGFPRTAVEAPFSLSHTNGFASVIVTTDQHQQSDFWNIAVTVFWKAGKNEGSSHGKANAPLIRSVTVVGGKSAKVDR